jgi:hypothetical protein
MKIVRSQPSTDLRSEVKRRFSEFNLSSRPSKGRIYPEDLRELVREAIKQGMEPSALHQLTGLSRSAIHSWTKVGQKSKKPRRLEVTGPSPLAVKTPSAFIRFPSGISIELPDIGTLTCDLLTALSKAEVANVASR